MSTAPATARQFGLLHIFALISGASVLLGIGTWNPVLAIILVIFLGLFAIGLALNHFAKLQIVQILVLIGIAVVVIALLVPTVNVNRTPSLRSQSSNNIRQLVLALHSYHEVHGSFPPQYVADAQGKPLYSWRVLILPFMEEERLYQRFHLDEPWDSPHNITLLQNAPAIFGSPRAPNSPPTVTNYVGISGDDTAWQGATALNESDFRDGTANTWHLVEWTNSDIAWSEPRDIPMDEVHKWWSPPSGERDAYALVGFADTHADGVTLRKLTAPQLRSLITPAGGEPPMQSP